MVLVGCDTERTAAILKKLPLLTRFASTFWKAITHREYNLLPHSLKQTQLLRPAINVTFVG